MSVGMRWMRMSVPEIPPRFDLELQTLVEILEGDRIVHCHPIAKMKSWRC